jgi:hypothetical protein
LGSFVNGQSSNRNSEDYDIWATIINLVAQAFLLGEKQEMFEQAWLRLNEARAPKTTP